MTGSDNVEVQKQAGLQRFHYPAWLPGNHSPTGQIEKLAGLVISGNGQRLDWVRDPLDVYTFNVPANAAGALTASTLDGFVAASCANNTLDSLIIIYDANGFSLATSQVGGLLGRDLYISGRLVAGESPA